MARTEPTYVSLGIETAQAYELILDGFALDSPLH
jgi:hypothetical protein